MQPLPIDSLLPEIIASLRRTPNLVIEAAPGAGKTTRVPPALLDAGVASAGEIWVLEPRRLAARLSARRVAEERGERLGETIGYQVRFEEVASPRTRVRFLTEGILTRRLLQNPQLSAVNVIILDEFHERHLQTDLTLALLRRLQQSTRPDLRIVVMSATLDVAPIARFLDNCPVLRAEGRQYDVVVEHQTRNDDRTLEAQTEAAARRLITEEPDGDLLVFLPGAAEIRRAQEACVSLAAEGNLRVLPLHGALPPTEQDRAVRPSEKRKIVLSTNVAETSVTIESIVAVIDSGMARIASHSPWSGLPRLEVSRISRAAAIQRAGRAGRTRAGRAVRLYTAQDFSLRPEYETPEIRRLDLAEAVLALHAVGITDPENFRWFETPPTDALRVAESLLHRLGALDAKGVITPLGERILRFPLHPRLARLVVESESRGVAREGCIIAALAAERDIRTSQLFSNSRERINNKKSSPSDLLELLDRFAEAEQVDFNVEHLRRMNLDPGAAKAVDRVRRQLEKLCAVTRSEGRVRGAIATDEDDLLISILTAYPDRVARRRPLSNEARQDELLLAGGGGATLAPESVVREREFLVAVDVEERREVGRKGGRGARVAVRLASAIEPEWLLDLFTDQVTETTEVEWNAQAERVETLRRLVYDGLVLDERRTNEAGGADVTRVLAEAAIAVGWQAFTERETVERFLARVEFAARTLPEAGFPDISEEDVRASLISICEGRRSFAELRDATRRGELLDRLRRKLDAEQTRRLMTIAPERVTLKSGRAARINYEPGRQPWLASRLQDFFGMKETPKVANGKIPIVLHLLAPNNRPVQVTTDLAGFWQRHYPQVRRELSRRYPRHDWRENPLS